MDGREFLEVAQELARGPQEAALRSAVSRAYYAAYNYGRQILRQLGFQEVAERRSHGEVWMYFGNCGESRIASAGRMLGDLQSERVGADYRLGNQKYQNPKNAEACVKLAQRIVQQFERCEESAVAATVAEGMKRYRGALSP